MPSLWTALCLVLVAAAPMAAQQPAQPGRAAGGGAQAAARSVRTLFFQRDYETAYDQGRVLVERYPRSSELRAWWVLALEHTSRDAEGLKVAEAGVREQPRDGWSNLALAYLLMRRSSRRDEALALAATARRAGRWQPDFVWLQGSVLRFNARRPQAMAMLDSAVARGWVTPELVALKGELERSLMYQQPPDTAALTRALGTAGAALRLDSGSVAAWILLGDCRSMRGDRPGTYEAYRRALALAPLSADVHLRYWDATQSLRDRGAEQNRGEILADIESLLQARRRSAGALLAAATGFELLDLPARRDSAEAEILARFPAGAAAEQVVNNRVQRLRLSLLRRTLADTVQAHAQLRESLRAFIARRQHFSTVLRDRAYSALFGEIAGDTTVAPAELIATIRGLMRSTEAGPSLAYVRASAALAERHIAPELAERLGREAGARLVANFHRNRAAYLLDDPDAFVRSLKAQGHDALGWVYFNQGKLPLARGELNAALELRPRLASALYHMGRLEEARGRPESAEKLYARGYAAERQAAERPSEQALQRLYRARRGSSEGYPAFLQQLQEKEQAERRDSVLARRLKTPREMPAFRLARLDGDSLASATLRGRIVVINFWGVWCGPCVTELPQIQALHQKFRNDPGVVFLTVDNDSDVGQVRSFMATRKFDFTVLLDDGYVDRAGVNGFPTTWFVGRDGRIVYEVMGGRDSDSMVEEYVWRIEALRAPKVTLAPR